MLFRSLLREHLGFEGLVVTDALVMEAITAHYGAGEAAVLALEAGADLVLMPADADLAMRAILVAVADGRLERGRLEASAARRRQALELVRESSDQPAGPADAAEPLGLLSNGPCLADQALALELVRRSLVHQGGRLRHVAQSPAGLTGVNLIRVDAALGCPYLPAAAPTLSLPAKAGFRAIVVDGSAPSPWRSDAPDAPLDLDRLGEGPVLLQLFVRGNPFRGSASGREPWPAVIRQLQELGQIGRAHV